MSMSGLTSFFYWLLVTLFYCSECKASALPLFPFYSTTSLLAATSRQTTVVPDDKNPLWPGGISDEDVDLLVKEIIKDPTLNIASIPDSLETQIYRSTVKIVLNAIYRTLSQFHRKPLPAGHELKLGRVKGKDLSKKRIQTQYRE